MLTALAWLQKKYGFGERYLLAGHSCGATLAFQVAMTPHSTLSPAITKPLAILGVEGIYDLLALRNNHCNEPYYQHMLQNAFGTDETRWTAASPVSGDYNKHWPNAKLTVLAHSFQDELVEKEQMGRMEAALKEKGADGRVDVGKILKGRHDDVWKEGTELVKSIRYAVDRLVTSKV